MWNGFVFLVGVVLRLILGEKFIFCFRIDDGGGGVKFGREFREV